MRRPALGPTVSTTCRRPAVVKFILKRARLVKAANTLAALHSLLILALANFASADPGIPVRITNSSSNPVPVAGTVGIAGRPTVNVGNTVTVTTSHDPNSFVVPFALTVTGTDHIGVTLSRPAILDSIATSCNGSLRGTHFQVITDFSVQSATAFDAPPAGTQLVARSSLTGVYAPVPMSLNYPDSDFQALFDYPSLTTDRFNVTGLNQVVLSDVNVLGPAFNPGATYCWGYFLFRKL
jgi:hypothetical protein